MSERYVPAPKKIDLTNKESWTIKNAKQIAEYFGYPCNKEFISILQSFLPLVHTASITEFLGILFEGKLHRCLPKRQKQLDIVASSQPNTPSLQTEQNTMDLKKHLQILNRVNSSFFTKTFGTIFQSKKNKIKKI
jgi:hypothetical protein